MKYTELKKTLTECAVNPQTPGKWKVLADFDFSYYLDRSVECIKEAKFNAPDENIKMAITLLAMARVKHKERGVTEKLDDIKRFDK